MNSLSRIRLSLRAAIAELPKINFFLTTLLATAGICIFLYAHYSGGGPTRQLVNVSPAVIIPALSLVGFFTAMGLSGSFFTKRLKETNRAEAFLSLPISNGERYAVTVLYHWVFVPLITYGPLFVITAVATQFTYADFLLPSLRHLPTVFFESLIVYLLLSTLWLFPAIAFPRKLVIVAVVLVAVAVGANLLVDDLLPNPSLIHAVDSSVFGDPSVVGVGEIARYSDKVPKSEVDFGSFGATYVPGLSASPFLLAIPFFLFAAYRGLTLKQA